MLDQLFAGHPLYRLAFELAGGASILWNFVEKGIPRIVAWLLPHEIKLVRLGVNALLAHPTVKAAVVANLPAVKTILQEIDDGIKEIADAAVAEADADLEQAAEPPAAPPAPAPAPDPASQPPAS